MIASRRLGLTLLPWVLTLAALHLLATGVGSAAENDRATVKAVLFHGPNCAECGELLTHFVPALVELHGEGLEIAGIDVASADAAFVYRKVADDHGLPGQWDGRPLVLVGNRLLSGLPAIATALGDELPLLASQPEALSWPDVPGLAAMLPAALADMGVRVAEADPLPELPEEGAEGGAVWTNQIANGMAVLVLIGMIAVTGYSVYRVSRRAQCRAASPGWILAAILVGFVISAYTAYTALADTDLMCGPVGDCAAVQHSEYARMAGIPMGVLGLMGYGLIFAAWVVARRLSPGGGGWRWIPWAVTLAGVLFSMRLTALEPFVIGATCVWCLGSAVAITVLLWLLSCETGPGSGEAAESSPPRAG